MLLSPNREYVSFRQSKRDSSMSPCRASSPLFHHTPPNANSSLTYDTPMLSPSPRKRRALPSPGPVDPDDVFQSPLRSYNFHSHQTPPGPPDSSMLVDEDTDLFLGPSPSSSAPFASSSPAFFRTPRRIPMRDLLGGSPQFSPDRPALSLKRLNGSSGPFQPAGLSVKRKSTTTPSRSRTMTPLNVASNVVLVEGDPSSLLFDRLAPLSAPRFALHTPHNKVETELHLKRQAETMTMLSLRDLDGSGDESGYDSDHQIGSVRTMGHQPFLLLDSPGGSVGPFASTKARMKTKELSRAESPSPESSSLSDVATKDDEVAEAVSPDGHVSKRRARSRPVSLELLEAVHNTPPRASPLQVSFTPRISHPASPSTVTFPSARNMRPRKTSDSSVASSDAGSPRRPSAAGATRTRTQSHTSRTLNRLQSTSSATLFFGPSIPNTARKEKKSTRTVSTTNTPVAPRTRRAEQSAKATNRHSYAGADGSPTWVSRSPATPGLPSTPPPAAGRKRVDSDDAEADLFFNSGAADSSFAISLKRLSTPSPKKKQKRESLDPLPRKFRSRDSGVVLTDSDEDLDLPLETDKNYLMAAMPRASSSVSTVASDDHGLLTPGVGPSLESGWPTVVNPSDDAPATHMGMGRSVDAFILKTLAQGGTVATRGDDEHPKRAPGTPVKKLKTAHLVGGVQRPWQSAVAHKIGFKEFDDGSVNGMGKKAKPRKSLPAAFPGLGRAKENKTAKKEMPPPLQVDRDGEAEEDVESPTMRRDARYDGLGLGRPTTGIPQFARPSGEGRPAKGHWLMRRSSSGAFSSSSDASSINATPTRLTPKEWGLPPARVPTPSSPLKRGHEDSARSGTTSGSSSGTTTATNSPTLLTRHPFGNVAPRERHNSQLPLGLQTPALSLFTQRPHTHAHPARQVHPQVPIRQARLLGPSSEEHVGRFGRDFAEIDELGSGEFGRAMKVRYKDPSRGADIFAIKKSKRFEGFKHRLRLREEVEILKHLSDIASRHGSGGHPNILGYIDGWEEDETLYIQTELCELGNFSHFLWEYGRAFQVLDEARVWKIMAELASGLRFIHDANVIHLDLKPANIFLTGEGRLKIGDFGMASLWPRPVGEGETPIIPGIRPKGFEREGDKLYLAPEVLQGRYGKAADVFSLGMTMLETASNIVVPDQGEAWHRLRREDFSQVQLDTSPELWDLLKSMMRAAPALRIGIALVDTHPVVMRARRSMERMRSQYGPVFGASPLGAVPPGFLDEILARGGGHDADDDWEMDLEL
ncbi:uncharacterized protein BXZ73DRAFT_41032 [Epithele typhae]|uniref:uncharacterized protein n=1 Tax=Epithele typhae TaxID=378194 RepID=UPI002008940A|nr:uncharacterized protein BXZ73DRAFT_41032 [Epithele typhae]KAH9942269.1 hypothetical protein BXZ73DRAFT_41032 [Epithele typhae]